MPQETRLATGKQFTSIFESYIETDKTVQQMGRALTIETAAELARLRNESPKATGLLAKSWRGYTQAKQDRQPPPIIVPGVKKPANKINLDDVYPEWFDEYYATRNENKKTNKAIKFIGDLLLVSAFIPLVAVRFLFGLYKRFPVLKELPRKMMMALCTRVVKAKQKLANTPMTNRIRLYIRIYNTAPNSYFRIVGRAAGRMPPVKKLQQWAMRKGLPKSAGYVIAKLIAERGSGRYRSGENVVGINPKTRQYRTDAGFNKLINRVLLYAR
jgi:hypothetical protein